MALLITQIKEACFVVNIDVLSIKLSIQNSPGITVQTGTYGRWAGADQRHRGIT
jgi:hypothetical protein